MAEENFDFDSFDDTDLGDVNPDDLDIEKLERELGLLKEEKTETIDLQDHNVDSSNNDASNVQQNDLQPESSSASTQVATSSPPKPSPDPVAVEHVSAVTPSVSDAAPVTASEVSGGSAVTTSTKQPVPTSSDSDATAVKATSSPKTDGAAHANKTPTSSAPSTRQQKTSPVHIPQNRYPQSQNTMQSAFPYNNYAFYGANPLMNMYRSGNMAMGFTNRVYINPNLVGKQTPVKPQTVKPQAVNSDLKQKEQELNEQREQIKQMMLKRRQKKQHTPEHDASPDSKESAPVNAGQKRMLNEESDVERMGKRANIMPMSSSPNGGIRIKGAAAAARANQALNSNTSPAGSIATGSSAPARPIFARLQERKAAARGENTTANNQNTRTATTSSPSIIPRSKPLSDPSSEERPAKRMALNNPSSGSQTPSATDANPSGSAEKGVPTKLVIGNLSEDVTDADIQSMGKSISAGITDISFDHTAKKATVTLPSKDLATIFRRKFNRSQLKGTHITIHFV